MRKRLKIQGREELVSKLVPKKVRGIPSLVEGETPFPEAGGKETGQVQKGFSL